MLLVFSRGTDGGDGAGRAQEPRIVHEEVLCQSAWRLRAHSLGFLSRNSSLSSPPFKLSFQDIFSLLHHHLRDWRLVGSYKGAPCKCETVVLPTT